MSPTLPDPAARGTRLVLLVGVALGAVMGLYLPFVAVTLDSRGLSPAAVGIVLSISAAVQLIAAPSWGQVADTRLGRARALSVVCIGAGMSVACMVVAPAAWIVGGLVVVTASFTTAFNALSDAITVNVRPDPRSYVRIRIWLSVAYAVTSLAGGIAYAATDLSLALVLFSAGCFGVAVFATRLPDRGLAASSSSTTAAGLRRRLLDGPAIATLRTVRPLRWILVALSLTFFCHVAGYTYLTLRIAASSSPSGVGLSGALSAITEVPVMLVAGSLAERFGLRALFVTGSILAAVASSICAVADQVPILLLTRPIIGASYACLVVAGVITIRRLLPGELQATGQTLFQALGFGLAAVVLNLAGGFIVTAFGDHLLYALTACTALVGAGVAWWVYGWMEGSGPSTRSSALASTGASERA